MTISKLALVALLASLVTSDANAQDACAALRRADSVRTWCDVDRRPVLRGPATAIAYPDFLLSANVEGEVRLVVDLDSTGRVVAERVRVAASSHDLFTNAVRRVLIGWRFEPARVDAAAVPARIEIDAQFELPRSRESVPWRLHTDVRESPRGYRTSLRYEPIPRDSAYVASAATRDSAMLALIGPLAGQRTDSAPPVCVVWRTETGDRDLPSAVMHALRARSGRLLTASECPPKSAIEIRPTEPHPIRTGRADLVRVLVHVRTWANGAFVGDLLHEAGWRGKGRTCTIVRVESEATWATHCPGERVVLY